MDAVDVVNPSLALAVHVASTEGAAEAVPYQHEAA